RPHRLSTPTGGTVWSRRHSQPQKQRSDRNRQGGNRWKRRGRGRRHRTKLGGLQSGHQHLSKGRKTLRLRTHRSRKTPADKPQRTVLLRSADNPLILNIALGNKNCPPASGDKQN